MCWLRIMASMHAVDLLDAIKRYIGIVGSRIVDINATLPSFSGFWILGGLSKLVVGFL